MKKILLLCVAMLALTASASAQNVDTAVNMNEIFIEYEVEPSFTGGYEALYKFVEENLIIPQEAVEKGLKGRVCVQFIIDTDGTVTNPRVLRDIGGGCGEEALRIVKLMPKWIPGKLNGNIVRVRYVLPYAFIVQ